MPFSRPPCTCTYSEALNGKFWFNSSLDMCECHPKPRYACEATGCKDYRPVTEPFPRLGEWPKCVCGEIAQEHN